MFSFLKSWLFDTRLFYPLHEAWLSEEEHLWLPAAPVATLPETQAAPGGGWQAGPARSGLGSGGHFLENEPSELHFKENN